MSSMDAVAGAFKWFSRFFSSSRREDRSDFRAVTHEWKEIAITLKADMEDLKKEIISLKSELRELKTQYAALEDEHADCRKKNIELETRIHGLELREER